MPQRELLLFLLLCITIFPPGCSYTDPEDVAVLETLRKKWKNVPPNWQSIDPCGDGWIGITCNNYRVIDMTLFNMDIQGTLINEISNLRELRHLDLSSNLRLEGTLPVTLGNLVHLDSLKLINCSFIGEIPDSLGNLANLTFLALNSNNFTGKIPPSLGKLSQLNWLDLADNQLSGPLPVSANYGWGLDMLLKAEHFHFNQNNLTGEIPESLFSSDMALKHILLDRNQLMGPIPRSIGLVQNMEVIRLDNNGFTGPIPLISNLTKLNFLNLANNSLTGLIPNLTTLTALKYLDLSNNQFDSSEVPAWISNLKQLRTLVIESGQLYGQIPQELFSFNDLQEVSLRNNSLNGTFHMGNNVNNNSLNMVNLALNNITSVTLSSNYNKGLMLQGNPVCSIAQLSNTAYCNDMFIPNTGTRSLNLTNCAHPFSGILVFRAPFFSDPSYYITDLVESLANRLKTCSTPSTLSIQNYYFDTNTYFLVQVQICPVDQSYFERTTILDCFDMNSEDYEPPMPYRPYYYTASPYMSPTVRWYIIGIVIVCAILAGLLVLLGVYAVRLKKRARIEKFRSNPFASWGSMGEDSGEAPKISGAKAFSYNELKMYTDNFEKSNVVGCGGYGKVYRGMLPDKLIAIKRPTEGSMQGCLEFKTEIELLSCVHHKNLVELLGFCCDQGERMLVYEYICNGTLKDCLSGENGIHLNWSKRLKIALDSATGLAYLHNHANPPIIHRDVKSTNILLDKNLTAKVSDFGLSLFVSNSETGHVTADVRGTLGYLDPEYYTTQKLTSKSDVYSFGVVMLELITAQPPIKDEKYIVIEVKTALDRQDKQYLGLKDSVDPVLIDKNENLVGLDRFLDLALQCVEIEAGNRPTMNRIVREIEDIIRDSGFKINSVLSFPEKINSARCYSMDVCVSSSSSQENVSSSDFRYSGGFPSQLKPDKFIGNHSVYI